MQETKMQVNDPLSLGQAIRNRRKELSYTQKYISEVTGFSMSFLSDLENGKATCEIGKTIHLINLLGLDIDIEARE
jgi:transcriptional regulator with XRE-family HTH domain